jgi:hypothetical protein
MCFGAEAAWVPAVIAAVGAAAGGAGTYAGAKAQKLDIESRDAAARMDRQRQTQLQEEADARLRNEVQNFAPEKTGDAIDIAAATRAAASAPPAAAPAQYQAAPTNAPVEVKAEGERKLRGVASKAAEEASRKARLAAYGDLSQQQGFQLNRLGENFRQLGADSRA